MPTMIECELWPRAFIDAGCIMKRGRSSGVEHNLAKVGVVGSNPIARSSFDRSIA